MAKYSTRQPIEVSISSPENNHIPVYDEQTRLWKTVESSSIVTTTAISASYALTSSAATSITFTPTSASFATTASAAASITFTPTTASFATTASAATSITFTPVTASFATSASWAPIPLGTVSSSAQISTGSFTGSFTGSLLGSASFATSASWAPIVTGTVSSSAQISTGSFTGSFIGLHTGSFTGSFVGIYTGSYTGSFTGSLLGSASFATTASAATSITFTPATASFATSASWAPTLAGINTGSFTGSFVGLHTGSYTGSFIGSLLGSSSFATTASAATSITFTPTTASFATTSSFAVSASWAPTLAGINTGSFTGSFVGAHTGSFTGSYAGLFTGSFVGLHTGSYTGSFTGVLLGSSSFATTASAATSITFTPVTASFATTASAATSITFIPTTASFATSASWAPTALGVISSSAQINTGSFTGSFIGLHTGSFTGSYTGFFTGSFVGLHTGSYTGSFTGSLLGSASFATTASAASSITFTPATASFATTASAASSLTFTPATASFAITASYVSSQAVVGTVTSASFATTASNLNGGTTNYIPLWSTTTAQTSSVMYQNTGNIGIGTTSPNRRLQIGDVTLDANSDQAATLIVSGGITLRGGNWLSLDNGYTVHSRMRWDPVNTAAEIAMKLDSYYGFDFQTRSGNSKMVIRGDNGNVGIGNTNPSYKLDVNGAVRLASGANRPTTVETSGMIYTQGESGGWAFGHHAKGVSDTDRGGFGFLGSADALTYYYIGRDYITPTMVVTSGSAGRVGIGTTSPAYTLDVNGTIGLSGFPFALKSGNYNVIYEPAGNPSIYLGNATDPSNYYDNSVHYWRNRGGGTVQMYLNGTGLGIGTTSPSGKLHLSGSDASRIALIAGQTKATRIGANSAGAVIEGVDYTGVGSYQPLYVGGSTVTLTTSNTDRWVVNASGHLVAATDNTYDIGASGATRPRNVFVAGIVSASAYTSSISNGVGFFGTSSLAVSATTLATARNINGVSFNGSADITINRVFALDDRIKAPSDDSAGYMTFGFTSWTNNNTGPWADYLHLRSYTDSSGGNDNLLMFRKDALGIRLWQQSWNSATAYSTFKDVAWTDGTNASGTWGITSSLAVSSSFATTASYVSSQAVVGTVTSASFATTASFSVSASWAPATATFPPALNIYIAQTFGGF